MRKFIISAAILSFIGGTSLALAQDRDHREGPGRGNNRPPAAAPAAAPVQPSPPPAANGHNAIGQAQFREHHDAPSPQRMAQQPAQTPADAAAQTMRGINRSFGNAPNTGRPDTGNRDNDAGQRDNNRNNNVGQRDNRDNNAGRRDDNNRSDFNRQDRDRRDVRGPDNRRDFNNGRGDRRRDYSNYRNYHQNFRASQRFRAPAYRRPPGYFARRWSWGQTLPVSFWTRDYWLTDFNTYDLPPPPYGATWVRVGDDALLIDEDTGEIIEVQYGVFY